MDSLSSLTEAYERDRALHVLDPKPGSPQSCLDLTGNLTELHKRPKREIEVARHSMSEIEADQGSRSE